MHQSRDLLIELETAVNSDINNHVFLLSELLVCSRGY